MNTARRSAFVALQAIMLQVATACCGPDTERVPGCPEENTSRRLAPSVAPIQPALTPDYVYYFSADTPPRLMRTGRVDEVSELVTELPSDAEPLALAASERYVVYLDEGRGAVFALPVDEGLPAQERKLASALSFAGSAGLGQRDGVFVWGTSLESPEGGSALTRWAASDDVVSELAVLANEQLIHLAFAEGSLLLQVRGPEGARVLRVDLESGLSAPIAEIECSGLFVQATHVYCPFGNDLYAVPLVGGAPTRARSAAHVSESLVVDDYWYLLLPSAADASRAMVARLPLGKGNVQLLGCGAVRASGMIADSRGVFWHTSDESSGVRSLDMIAF